jgi:undecaprenyl diphosphate synthase
VNKGKPAHLGVIMDGNRRWAKRHGLRSLINGHEEGARKFIDVCTWCIDAGVPHLSVYAFSTENWNRAREEVDALMRLVKSLFLDQISLCVEKNIRVRIVGNRSRIPADVLAAIDSAEARTAGNTALTVQIALSYGGRDEILRAAQSLCRDVAEGRLDTGAVDETAFAARLDTAGAPDIDMVIRTGGQRRLSNFFPWQTVYAEMFFLDALWPDFSREMFMDALEHYKNITINLGK